MAQINVKVDDKVKKKAEAVCEELGLSLSSAINIYLRKIGREDGIPFELSLKNQEDKFFSKENIKFLEKEYQAYKDGKLKLVNKDIIED